MTKLKKSYEDISLTCVENGYTLSWWEKNALPDESNYFSNRKTMIFSEDEGTEALKVMRKMHGNSYEPTEDDMKKTKETGETKSKGR